MGKSEIVHVMPRTKTNENIVCLIESNNDSGEHIEFGAKNNSNNRREGEEDEEMIEIFQNQVAGHSTDGVGLLKQNDVVLKPITKKECGEREIKFYEQLRNTTDKNLMEMREFLPKYYGTKTITINKTKYECLILEDLTRNFKEPCVMDLKIGRRTYGPDANYKKMLKEEEKYRFCKKDLAFCIPGFQYYRIDEGGKFMKFGKEFGKSLDKNRAIDAIRSFLNNAKCRRLIVQFLAVLWRLQHFFRKQTNFKLYSSSILLVYDARMLRQFMEKNKLKSTLKLTKKESLYRPMSLAVLNNEKIPTGFSGQLTKDGPILKSPNKMLTLDLPRQAGRNVIDNAWQKSIHVLKRTHSFQNNYDKEVQNKKQSYNDILEDLCAESQIKSECWATVKIIDLAHVYPTKDHTIDRNYLEGIENLVKIFEEFLIESE